MDPIVLNEFGVTLVVMNFNSEDQKVPYDSPNTYIGVLKHGGGYVYAAVISETYYAIFHERIGQICEPIPLKADTFAKLRKHCAEMTAVKAFVEKTAIMFRNRAREMFIQSASQ